MIAPHAVIAIALKLTTAFAVVMHPPASPAGCNPEWRPLEQGSGRVRELCPPTHNAHNAHFGSAGRAAPAARAWLAWEMAGGRDGGPEADAAYEDSIAEENSR